MQLLQCAGQTPAQPLARIAATWTWRDVHIDGGESAVGDGAADSTSESEARVQVKAGGRGGIDVSSDLGLGGIDLAGAGGGGRRSGGHCEVRWNRRQRVEWRG